MLEAGLSERLDDDEVSEGEEDVESPERPKTSARSTPLRGRGRGRGSVFPRNGTGRMTLAQKLGLSVRSPPSDKESEDEGPLDDSDAFTSTTSKSPPASLALTRAFVGARRSRRQWRYVQSRKCGQRRRYGSSLCECPLSRTICNLK